MGSIDWTFPLKNYQTDKVTEMISDNLTYKLLLKDKFVCLKDKHADFGFIQLNGKLKLLAKTDGPKFIKKESILTEFSRENTPEHKPHAGPCDTQILEEKLKKKLNLKTKQRNPAATGHAVKKAALRELQETNYKIKTILGPTTHNSVPDCKKLFGYKDFLGEGVRNETYQVTSNYCEFLIIPKSVVLKIIKFLYSASIEGELMALHEEFHFFNDWDRGVFRGLKDHAVIRTCKRGNYIFRAGDPVNYLYLLTKGTVDVCKGEPVENMKNPENANAPKVQESKLAKTSENSKYKEFKLFEINHFEFMCDYDSLSKNPTFYTSHKVISESATYVCFGIEYFLEQISYRQKKILKASCINKRNYVEDCFMKTLKNLDGNFKYLFYIPPKNPKLISRPISNYSAISGSGAGLGLGNFGNNMSCTNFEIEKNALEDSVVNENFNRKPFCFGFGKN